MKTITRKRVTQSASAALPPARLAGRFGKHAPKHDYRTLLFADYAAQLPAPPETLSNIARAVRTLDSTVAALFPMDDNDRYGCCTIAGKGHAVTLFRGLIGQKVIPSAASVKKDYFRQSGGEDTGLNMLDVLNDWRKKPFDADEILAFVKVDPKNHDHVKQAIQYFGGVYTGFQVQANAIADFTAHRIWTPGKRTQDGHAVLTGAYDPKTVTVLTWGDQQPGTWAWWDECVDEAYAVIPPEAKNSRFAPGFNFAQLQADLAAIAA